MSAVDLSPSQQAALKRALTPEEQVRLGELRLYLPLRAGPGLLVLCGCMTLAAVGCAVALLRESSLAPWLEGTRPILNQVFTGIALVSALFFGSASLFFLRGRTQERPTLVAGTDGVWVHGTFAGSACLAWEEVERVAAHPTLVGFDVHPTLGGLARLTALQQIFHRWGLIRVLGLPLAGDPTLVKSLETIRREWIAAHGAEQGPRP